ncbi:hypothetical protein BJ912DRAFT_352658 [Pholiota molesta]|nr:hypothetical protein BJ912DRAFT_352658 [Pholiota molesta]
MEEPQFSVDSIDSVPYTDMSIPSISLPDDNDDLGPYNDPNLKSEAEILLERQAYQLSALFSANEILKKDTEKLKPAASRDISGDTAQKLDSLLDSFIRGAGTVLDELTVLGNAHPFLAVVIFAFREVVSLDIARRDNNKKVVVVVLQMQSMLGPMLQLRNLSRSHMHKAEKQFYEDRLAETVECIRKDIDKCRSDIMYFMNRKFLNKLVLAKGYEKAFASHMETFSKRRAELQTVISEYIAIGVSDIAEKVDVMDVKLDKIISVLFRNLDTPREAEVFKFLHDIGGPEKCVNDPNLLQKLASKAGVPLKSGKAELEDLRKSLREALNEDLDKVLEKHYSRFEKALEVQSKNLQRITSDIEEQGPKLGKILETVTTIRVMEEGRYRMKEVRLKDPEIQDVWTRMNLGPSSVKAKVFVLTFRDYIRSGNSAVGTPTLGLVPLPQDVGETNLLQPTTSESNTDDSKWVLEYIDVAYVQPIVEAIDEDGSGFISVKEANSFGLSRDRPKDMKLLSWIAYWAAGWHINLVRYQKDIYSILLQMHKVLPSIHVANRTYVDDFLDEEVMRRVEALCRSLKPLPNTYSDPKLLAVANEVASWQLEHLNTNLKEMGFVIESSFDIMTISGSTRVETCIFPLLYLLLQRYLEIVNIAKTVVLDPREFESHVNSLSSVFWVFDERKKNLEAKFRQLHKDVDAQFHSFSYGMFYAAYKKNELDTWLNTLLTQTDEYVDQKDTSVTGKQVPNMSILSKPAGEVLKLDDLNLLPSSTPPPSTLHIQLKGNGLAGSAWACTNA